MPAITGDIKTIGGEAVASGEVIFRASKPVVQDSVLKLTRLGNYERTVKIGADGTISTDLPETGDDWVYQVVLIIQDANGKRITSLPRLLLQVPSTGADLSEAGVEGRGSGRLVLQKLVSPAELSAAIAPTEALVAKFGKDVEALKVVADLNPGDVSDATMAIIARDPASNFRAELDAAFGPIVGGLVAEAIAEDTTIVDAAAGAVEAELAAKDVRVGKVAPEQTTFFNVSTNLYNPATATAGHALLAGNGAPAPTNGYTTSDHIPVTAGQSYTYNGVNRIAYYNSAGTFLSNSQPDRLVKTYVAPTGAVTARLSINDVDAAKVQMNDGSTLLAYEPGGASQIRSQFLPKAPDLTIADGSITPAKTTFFAGGANLFNKATVLAGHTLSTGASTPSVFADHNVSEPISVTGGATYSVNGIVRLVYFDAAGVRLSQTDSTRGATTHTAHASAATVRLVVHNLDMDKAQINAGATLLPYGPWTPAQIKPEFLPAGTGGTPGPVADGSITTAKLANSAVTPAKTTFFYTSTNLYNPATALEGHYLGTGTGTPQPISGYRVSAHIPVTAGTTYTYNGVNRVVHYDKAGSYLSHNTADRVKATYQAPANAASVRLSINNADTGIVQMNEGAALLPYEPYEVTLDRQYLPADEVDLTADRYVMDTGGLNEVYTAPVIDAQPTLDSATTADVYGWYDALVAAHPEYVTRRDLGPSSTTDRMYAYTFRPEPVASNVDGTGTAANDYKHPVAFVMSGIHGYEKHCIVHLYRFAKALCDEWATSPVLDALRWNIEFVIVPAASPHGINVSTRGNVNNVDLERNFTAGWAKEAEGSPNLSGRGGPLSEPETIAIDALMKEIAPRALFGASFHSFNGSASFPNMIWVPASSAFTKHVGQRLVSRMSRKWHTEHEWITTNTKFLGYADRALPGGASGHQMTAYGFPGATFETSRNQWLDGGTGAIHDSRAMTLGFEATVNYLALSAKAGLDALL